MLSMFLLVTEFEMRGRMKGDKESGFVQVHIPATKRKVQGDTLISIKALPDWAQPAFAGMTSLNTIQSKVCETALYTANNILMCAPTGAGKTNVAVLAILQIISTALLPDGTIAKDKFKIVYIAPMKALVAEQVGNFQKRLDEPLGISTRELTGGSLLLLDAILVCWIAQVRRVCLATAHTVLPSACMAPVWCQRAWLTRFGLSETKNASRPEGQYLVCVAMLVDSVTVGLCAADSHTVCGCLHLMATLWCSPKPVFICAAMLLWHGKTSGNL
jgi:hypothetical protein